MKNLRLEVYNTLLKTLNNYSYCILRNYEALPKYENDIDILVAKTQFSQISSHINNSFNEIGVEFIYHAKFGCESYFYFDSITGNIFHIDFFLEFSWKGYIYIDADEVLNNRVQYNEIFIPSSFYEYLDLFLTGILNNAEIKEKYYSKIILLKKRYSKELKEYFSIDLQIDSALSQQNKVPNSLIRKLRLSVRKKSLNLIGLHKTIYNKFLYLKRLIKRVVKYEGISIAFYGTDGAGKSTQIEMLKANIKPLFSRGYSYFHFKPFPQKKNKSAVERPHNKKNYNMIISIIKVFYYAWIFFLGYYQYVFPKLFKNTLVIFDRFFDDIILDPKRYRLKNVTLLSRIMSFFVFKPNLVFVLKGNPKTISSRKNELSILETEKQQNRMKNLFFDKKNTVFINGDEKIEVISKKVIRNIISFKMRHHDKK
ncbi:MAG: hypothetical protein D8M58_04335 [Calditrichaeota bacterium]|nr:MAG: hypothetical protein DWQ03_02740 [Calditrichota bacterium]MBL1204598.1 hypothetical protein [Calditrichota bacterium]NOG44427.1 hypothetical protein [Calditrichota bacterium]